ncbi:MAG: twin-arginine translocase subunit TatC [Planctomycetes bacterium]|nr:twin-arginine translocase subunit TatC [Planctomycetota bacterium]
MFTFEDKPQPFLEHFREFRKRLILSALALSAGFVGGYLSFPFWSKFLLGPLAGLGVQPMALSIIEVFQTQLKFSLISGVFYASPVIAYQMIAFILPALKEKERRVVFFSLATGLLMFGFGVYYCYDLVLPFCVEFFSALSVKMGVRQEIRYADTLSIVLQIILAFGLVFQFPIALFMLMWAGIVKRAALFGKTRHVILACSVVAAILTPPDPLSMIMLAVPLIILYLLTIGLAVLFGIG